MSGYLLAQNPFNDILYQSSRNVHVYNQVKVPVYWNNNNNNKML